MVRVEGRPCYILHQTVIVLLAALLRDRGWPAAAAGPAIVACTVLISLLGFEAARSVAWLAPFFGLPPKQDPARLNPSAPAPNRS